MMLLTKVKNKLNHLVNRSKKRAKIRRLFSVSADFMHHHPNAKTYLFILENPATLPALGFVFFRLAENRNNIKLVLSNQIMDAYQPHVHRWHSIGCLEMIEEKSVTKLLHNPQLIIVSEKKVNYRSIALLPFSLDNVNVPLIPYALHPHQVFTGKLFFLECLRKSRRLHKIVFSGNYSESAYNKTFNAYPLIVNRFKALQYLKKSMNAISFPSSKSEYLQTEHFFQWIDWNYDNTERRIDEHDWLSILSSSSFSLCLPGVHMPMCHNIIESMAVGTIPITQYGYLFNPPLVHGVNCINFVDEQDLLQKIIEIETMTDSSIEEIKNNVIDYFINHLDPTNIIKEIESTYPSEIQYFKEY
jgi:hypothetical protein